MTDRGDLTERIARTALDLSVKDLPPAALETIKLAILDCLACGVAGSRTAGARIMAEWADETSGRVESTILGTDRRASASMAAMANAVACHALDFDDVSLRMTHPSTTIVPALLAIGEAEHLSGSDVLDAYLAGFETEARLCRILNPEHYERGWHTTGTVGVLGATIAACRLYGLTVGQTRMALGIAASAASGIRRNAGSMVKPLHAGQAAFHGVQAAQLAGRGFTANESVMEGTSGFLDVFSTTDLAPRVWEVFGSDEPFEIVASGIALKRFACCGAIHTAQDALLDLMATYGLKPDDIVRIEARVNRLVPNILVHHVTRNGLEGKFSLEYSLAVCLLDGRAGLEQYSDQRAGDPRLLPIMELVEVIVDETIPVNLAFFASVVTVGLVDGSSVERRVDVPKGYPAHPLSTEEVVDKARSCCQGVLDGDQFQSLVEITISLENRPDVSALADVVATASIETSSLVAGVAGAAGVGRH
jgi:2-methylcitrate dehydratase PrpD